MSGTHNFNSLNQSSRETFTQIIGPVFEHSPWIAALTCERRPFKGLEDLHKALCETVRKSDEKRKLDLILAHPDLVGRAALAGTLTSASTAEQASAGLNQLSEPEVLLFQRYNKEYREKFGFSFVICARLNKKEAILSAFPRRLKNSQAEEINTALEEIYKIAYLRLQDIFGTN
jgi:2-oxo-4-hydroxy-4-carboxy-5-ureidoimidazoline decarboxylase